MMITEEPIDDAPGLRSGRPIAKKAPVVHGSSWLEAVNNTVLKPLVTVRQCINSNRIDLISSAIFGQKYRLLILLLVRVIPI